MIRLIENAGEALESSTHSISTKEKIQYLNQLTEIGYFAVNIGKYCLNAQSQSDDLDKIISSLDKKNTKILLSTDTKSGFLQALKNPKADLLEIPFSLLNEPEDIISPFNEKIIISYPVDFSTDYFFKNSFFQSFLKHCNTIRIKRIKFYNTTKEVREDAVRILFENCISDYPEIEFGSQFRLEEKLYKPVFDSAYSSGCRFFETSIKGWAKNETGTILPTEKILSYLASIEEKTDINPLLLESAYNTAKKIFSNT
ncbi:MAG: hypothetical protein LBQ84_00435 [Flavobacteriaceae bacterium]|jgi:hypothetical protein|nr:hypothetical protein [Flavobacteriaceae bacterium]